MPMWTKHMFTDNKLTHYFQLACTGISPATKGYPTREEQTHVTAGGEVSYRYSLFQSPI